MAVAGKCTTADDIVNGLVTVAVGVKPPQTYDPGTGYSQHYASGDSLNTFQVLDNRYKVAPSGWNEA